MKSDKLINELNKKKNIQTVSTETLDSLDLTEVERNFIKTYRPEKSLIVYGTLAPDKPNHHVVQHIQGRWQKGTIRGKLYNEGWGAVQGYPGFKHVGIEEQQEINVYVLSSDELVTNWAVLDEFEGEEYRRLLAQFELETGETGVGFIYAINEEK
ncbi:gamma-glutamylcyclotransferase family protein [Xanthocytophaga agilis]|uniref:Gamma-glutamylcyclotransferase n=1 Tax=Xanthocytophaga agilis TaxID=3048010 RepID=A0AAE3UDD6_9BACT|nr:gamma-glutamylcyclotransferase [Xanthocytophaga agilis]MDJ1501120.1 gamma-glutamylcyclotransferase [Xanthocytophaga agilis]